MRSILTLVRTEEAKRLRRMLGDNGGVPYRYGKTLEPREDNMSNTLTGVQKDNLLFELWTL